MVIKLKDNDYKLLMMFLSDLKSSRSNMGCNDPYDEEVELFTKEERIEMQKTHWEDFDEEDADGFLFNTDYVKHMIGLIKAQEYESPIYDFVIDKMEDQRKAQRDYMDKYKREHAACPECGGIGHTTTLAGYILNPDDMESYKDLNDCACSECGDFHTVHERVPVRNVELGE